MNTHTKNKTILKLILAIFIIELLSLISFKFDWLSATFFIILSLIALLFTLYKLEYGLWICLAELMIGSQGYLFYLNLPGFKVSWRLGLFLIVFFVWLIKYFRPQKYWAEFKHNKFWQNLLLFIVFLGLGVINGLAHNNGLKNVFFDANGYLYLGLFFVFYEVFKGDRQIKFFLQLLQAVLIYVSAKIFLTLYFFTHGFVGLTELFYSWIRDTRVGEITWAGGNFFRIFLQSQIYSLIAIFVIIPIMLLALKSKEVIVKSKNRCFARLYDWLQDNKAFVYYFIVLTIIQTSILISFSRSFWLGGLISCLALLVYLIYTYRKNYKLLAKNILILFLGAIASIVLMITIVNFPLPKPSGVFSADMLKNRMNADDAAASSRWNLLPILLKANSQAPLLGTGFGSTITYQTNDPRIKNSANPQGWYTTYTFEWGYLDTVTEIGLLGLLTMLILLGQIFYSGWLSLKNNRWQALNSGLFIGLIALIVTHGFSPYLNHPLGLGYLLLCWSIFSLAKVDKNSKMKYNVNNQFFG